MDSVDFGDAEVFHSNLQFDIEIGLSSLLVESNSLHVVKLVLSRASTRTKAFSCG